MDEGSSVEDTGQRGKKILLKRKKKKKKGSHSKTGKLKCRMGEWQGVAYVVRCKKH